MAGRGERGMLGIVVHGSGGPLEALGVPADAALTPFAGSYRFLDLALATLANSRVRTLGGTRRVGRRRCRLRTGVVVARPACSRHWTIVSSARRGSAVSTVAVLRRYVLQLDLAGLHPYAS